MKTTSEILNDIAEYNNLQNQLKPIEKAIRKISEKYPYGYLSEAAKVHNNIIDTSLSLADKEERMNKLINDIKTLQLK